MDFKKFLEWANYGFEKRNSLEPVGGTMDIKGELPFNPLKTEEILEELARPLGVYKPIVSPDIIKWGEEEVGALQIEVSPIGSSKIFSRRKIKDLRGETTWICKNIYPLTNENKLMGKETTIASEIFENLQKLSMEMIDFPSKTYPDFERLVNKLTHNVLMTYPSVYMFPTGSKKLSENYYKIYFEFRAMGMSRLRKNSSRAEQFDIDIFFDKQKGLVKIFGYDIDSNQKQHSWQVQPSEFNEYFAPSQSHKEVIDCVSKMFLVY